MDLAFPYFPQEDMSHGEEAGQDWGCLGRGQKKKAPSHQGGLGQVTSLPHLGFLTYK